MAISEKIIEHKDFGKITVVKSTRTRRISISIKPFEPLKVTLPVFVSFKKVEQFLDEKEQWIHRTLDKIRKLEDQYTIFKENTPFHTHEHELAIVRTEEERPKVSLKDKKILVELPGSADVQSTEIQQIIRWGIQAAWRKEARKYLPARLSEFSGKYGLSFNKVIIKNNKTRWGSCSQKNNINLSLHLMRLPDHLIDYILLHELAHTVHKNHSKRFWKQLGKICPNARSLDKEMKEYRIEIY
jgi:predicted metal-dependent hydrolase